jgi:tripeptide aminopeptidase
MEWNAFGVAERLMRYVQIDTQSDPNNLSFPSTEKQKDLSTLLLQELLAIGLVDATMDANGYVMATIPATIEQEKLDVLKLPVICFCAHVDTAPDCSGTNVKPILHQQYNGAPIVLPDDPAQIITVDKYPYLKKLVNSDIYFDTILSVKYVADLPTIGIETNSTNTFLIDNIVTSKYFILLNPKV